MMVRREAVKDMVGRGMDGAKVVKVISAETLLFPAASFEITW